MTENVQRGNLHHLRRLRMADRKECLYIEQLCKSNLPLPHTNSQKNTPQIALEQAQFLGSFTSKNTQSNYARSLKFFLEFCREKGALIQSVSEIERFHVDSWKRKLVESSPPQTAANRLASLLSFLKFAHTNEWTLRDVGSPVRLPRVQAGKGKTEALTESELTKILCSLEASYKEATDPLGNPGHKKAWLRYVVIVTLCSLGMRATELVSLKVCDLDLSGEFPRLHMKLKGGELHSPLISDILAALLKRYLVTLRKGVLSNDPLFALTPYSKKPLTREYLARMVKGIAKEHGVTKAISPHSCRATVASLLHKEGVPIGEIQELLGHRSILTTMSYVRKIEEEGQSAARKNPIFKLMGGG